MIDLIAIAIGVIPAIVYVGFFAIKVPSLPLAVIVICCLALMVYSFYTDGWIVGDRKSSASK
jgi:hypothetical protein